MATTESYVFRGQRADEEVVLVTKQHVWLLMPVLGVWLAVTLVIMAIIWWFGASHVSSMVIVIAVIIAAIYSFYFWFTWNNSDYIVTNQRVIKIDQMSLFNRVISEAEVHRIQEISTEIKGPVRTLLNFGTVMIKTASDDSKLDLDDVSDPYDVQQAIVQIQKRTLSRDSTVKLV